MSGLTVLIDITIFVLLILVPTVSEIFCKKKNKDIPQVLNVPYGVRITVLFIILFTIYFSLTMRIEMY